MGYGTTSYARAREILALPDLEENTEQVIDDLLIPQEARWLIGFWANRGSAQPAKRPSPWQVKYAGSVDNQLVWSQRARERIASDIHRVSHWSIVHASYDDLPVIKDATYFVDPPYVKKGTRYKYKDVDHAELGRWCFRQSFTNRVIACEQDGATWLPFAPLATVKSTRGTSAEVSWAGGPAGPGLGLWTGA